MQRIWISLLCCSMLLLSGCQLMPHAQGLKSSHWSAQQYQRQDQVEVEWKDKSFSFLLYQQQQGQQLSLVALGLTGQPLFQLQFDGQQVKVQQRIDQMRLLPFEFVVRDILFATYPEFSALGQRGVTVENSTHQQRVLIHQKVILQIQKNGNSIELNNVQVPYQMTLSPIENTLNSDQPEQGIQP
ncbi:DUF3261 domain-containing protein [Acinetobacter suaedae]|uniref:DUF3261 domain-containing protein n=1 Tax=Acinetobacter suaedae TaxID=2609668 RepID=A0A5P1UPM2_9GAMM|nr:DUF3261 domain-containing protein [Acinetobacter sp. C16S1]QER38675.1 DUF3261 domain-containing protein [Acinetobacter sp. C16S1]